MNRSKTYGVMEDGRGRSRFTPTPPKRWPPCRGLLLRPQTAGSRSRAVSTPEFFTKELHHTRKYAFENLLGVETDAGELDTLFRELCEEICRTPFRLTHRDYHGRNLMVSGNEVFIIDFQDARMGPVLYDPASLAFDSYVALDGAARDYLIHSYWETCGHLHFSDKEEYERALRATAIQRNLKAIGTFAYQKAVRGAERYLESIPHTVRMLQGHFEKRRDLGPLYASLERFLDALLQ